MCVQYGEGMEPNSRVPCMACNCTVLKTTKIVRICTKWKNCQIIICCKAIKKGWWPEIQIIELIQGLYNLRLLSIVYGWLMVQVLCKIESFSPWLIVIDSRTWPFWFSLVWLEEWIGLWESLAASWDLPIQTISTNPEKIYSSQSHSELMTTQTSSRKDSLAGNLHSSSHDALQGKLTMVIRR